MATWISIIRPAAPSPPRNPSGGGADEAIYDGDLTGAADAVRCAKALAISGLLEPSFCAVPQRERLRSGANAHHAAASPISGMRNAAPALSFDGRCRRRASASM